MRCTLVLWVLLHLQTCGRANSDADDAQSAPAGFEHVEYCGVDPTWRRRKRMELWRMAEALDDFHQPKMMPRKLHPESRRIWLSKDGNLAINFEAPTCVSGQPSIFECQILGLEHAVEYLLSVAVIKKPEKEDPAPELSEGLRTLYQETWLLDKIDDHVKFNVTIPALSMAQWNCPDDWLPYRSAPTASLRVAACRPTVNSTQPRRILQYTRVSHRESSMLQRKDETLSLRSTSARTRACPLPKGRAGQRWKRTP